jgi:hypothetical protein
MHAGRFLARSARRHPDRPLWLLRDRTIRYDEGAAGTPGESASIGGSGDETRIVVARSAGSGAHGNPG